MGILDESIPQLAVDESQVWVADAVVRFSDGGSAQFSRVKFLADGQLLAELDCPVYLPSAGDSGARKSAGSVVERAVYAAGAWESVEHAQVGVLIAIRDTGEQVVIESNVRRDALHAHARKWIEDNDRRERERSRGTCQLVIQPELRPAGDVRIGVEYQEFRVGPDAYRGHEQIGTFEFRWLLPEDHDKPLRERATA
jgi:hypothetical protein